MLDLLITIGYNTVLKLLIRLMDLRNIYFFYSSTMIAFIAIFYVIGIVYKANFQKKVARSLYSEIISNEKVITYIKKSKDRGLNKLSAIKECLNLSSNIWEKYKFAIEAELTPFEWDRLENFFDLCYKFEQSKILLNENSLSLIEEFIDGLDNTISVSKIGHRLEKIGKIRKTNYYGFQNVLLRSNGSLFIEL